VIEAKRVVKSILQNKLSGGSGVDVCVSLQYESLWSKWEDFVLFFPSTKYRLFIQMYSFSSLLKFPETGSGSLNSSSRNDDENFHFAIRYLVLF